MTMRFPVIAIVAASAITTSSLSSFSIGGVEAFSFSSSNLASSRRHRHSAFLPELGRSTRLYYERDSSSSDGKNKDQPQFNAWSVLSSTEEWISRTLDSANSKSNGNPYSRKEVSYVCETNADSPMIVAGIFRRLRETREQGERHGTMEEERAIKQGKSYHPSTLRQTQVVVIPSNEAMTESFNMFDNLINTINAARRNARDYVTDVSFERLDERMYGDDPEREWSVSVNCAHLHPDFGKQTAKQKLEQMKKEEEEVDLNLKAYKEQRTKARRSPYPSVVIEVRSTPPPDFESSPPPPPMAPPQESTEDRKEETAASLQSGVSLSDVQKLEALFGKSAAITKEEKSYKEKENDFYDSIGKSIEEISTVTPMSMAQHWIAENDPQFTNDDGNAAFTTSNSKHVDEGYEFVFTNLAMQVATGTSSSRHYLVMPTFLSSSATSLEKFTLEATKIVNLLPDLNGGKVQMSTFHPEHVDPTRRSPMSICVLEYKK